MPQRPVSDATIGERIRTRRKILGMSVRYAADRAAMSHSNWSRIENGLVQADNRFTLAAIAEALRCPVGDLTGQPPAPTDQGTAETGGAVYETVRAFIEADLQYGPMTSDAPPLAELERELELIRDLRVACDYSGAIRRLPDLVRGLHAAAYGPSRAGALRLLVIAADAASFVVRYSGNPSAACFVADRAQQAAEALEDPVMVALASWSRAHAATGCGLYQRAMMVAETAAAELEPHIELPDAAELLGQLYLTTAFARSALKLDGMRHIEEAERIAAQTGDSPALRLAFGPTNNRLWRISMETDAGDPGKAVEIARETDPTMVESVSRQMAYYSDTGRALARLSRDKEAVRMLLAAERLAPQRTRMSPLVAETVRSLLDRAKRNAGGVELRGLGERMGIAL